MRFLKNHVVLVAISWVMLLLVGATVANQLGEHSGEVMQECPSQTLNAELTTYEPGGEETVVMVPAEEMAAVLTAHEGVEMIDGYIGVSPYLRSDRTGLPLEENKLSADTTYLMSIDMPAGCLAQRFSRDVHRFETYGNCFSCKVYYPSRVERGEAGVIAAIVEANGRKFAGAVSFTATEGLSITHGDRYSVIDFDAHENRLNVRFYTGGTDGFENPDIVHNPYNANTIRAEFYAY